MRKKRVLAAMLALAMSACVFTGCNADKKDNSSNASADLSENPYGLRDNVADGTILHCLCRK